MQMSDKAITDNVIASASQLSEKVPGGSVNVKLISLKLKTSTSIPLYLGTGWYILPLFETAINWIYWHIKKIYYFDVNTVKLYVNEINSFAFSTVH